MTEQHKNEEYIEDEDMEMKQDMLLRQSKLLYPEIEEWVLVMAIKAHLNMEKLGEDYKPKTKEEGEAIKKTYFSGLEYKTEFYKIIIFIFLL